MFDLLIAAALLQAGTAAPDPCHAVEPAGPRPGHCTQWRPLAQLEGRVVFVDPAIRGAGDGFELSLRAVFAEPIDGGRSAILTYRFDCRRQTVAALQATFYDSRGAPVSRGPMSAQGEAAVTAPPGSVYGGLMTEFCPR